MNWTHGLFQVEEDGDEEEADDDEDVQREEDDNERPLLERADRVQVNGFRRETVPWLDLAYTRRSPRLRLRSISERSSTSVLSATLFLLDRGRERASGGSLALESNIY